MFSRLLQAPDGSMVWHTGPKPEGYVWPTFTTEQAARDAVASANAGRAE